MAYSLITGVTHESIPSEIINFAINTLGWAAIDTNIVAAPGADAGVGFRFRFEINTSNPDQYDYRTYCELVKDGAKLIPLNGNYDSCFCNAPYLNLTYRSPTKLHLFGDSSTKQWLSAIIEYDPGSYRHMYAGYMEKLGDYTGGEVCSISLFSDNRGNLDYRYRFHKYLFGGLSTNGVTPGGIRIVHGDVGGDNTFPFAALPYNEYNSGSQYFIENAVFGGFPSNVNDVMLAFGENAFAGVSMLTPVNCYFTKPAGRVVPIGRPPGVRMVNMTNIDPAAAITVGGKTWRCFPQFRKGGTSGENGSTSDNYDIASETSYIVGYAYQAD